MKKLFSFFMIIPALPVILVAYFSSNKPYKKLLDNRIQHLHIKLIGSLDSRFHVDHTRAIYQEKCEVQDHLDALLASERRLALEWARFAIALAFILACMIWMQSCMEHNPAPVIKSSSPFFMTPNN